MTTDLGPGEWTPFPVDQLTQIALTKMEGDSMGRVVIRPDNQGIMRQDEWTEATDLITGLKIAVRRADCGLGCKCAAEVKLVQA